MPYLKEVCVMNSSLYFFHSAPPVVEPWQWLYLLVTAIPGVTLPAMVFFNRMYLSGRTDLLILPTCIRLPWLLAAIAGCLTWFTPSGLMCVAMLHDILWASPAPIAASVIAATFTVGLLVMTLYEVFVPVRVRTE